MREHYSDKGVNYCAERIGRSPGAIRHKAMKLGLKTKVKRDPRTTSERKPKNGFKPGNMPVSARKDGEVYCRMEGGKRVWFCKPAGRRKEVKLHRYTWERANGPVPKGRVLTFKNGNPDDCKLENLECITRGELVRRNRKGKESQAVKASWITRKGMSFVDRVLNGYI